MLCCWLTHGSLPRRCSPPRLWESATHETRTRKAKSPRLLDGLRNSNASAARNLRRMRSVDNRERLAFQTKPIMGARYSKRLGQPSRPIAQAYRATATGPHFSQPLCRLDGPKQDRASAFGDDIQTQVKPIGPINVSVPRLTEHGRISRSRTAKAVRSWIVGEIGLGFDNGTSHPPDKQLHTDQARSQL